MATFEVATNSEPAMLVRLSTGKLNPKAEESLKFNCFRKRENETKHPHFIVSTEMNGLSYHGKNFGISNSFQTDSCDYYVAIRKQGNNKIKVIPAHLFQLEPQFEDKPKETSTSDVSKEKQTYIEQRYELIKQFGSGKMQRNVNKRLKEKLDKGMISQTTENAVKKVTSEGSITSQSLTSTPSESRLPESSVLPPHNKKASSLKDVYTLNSLVPTDIRVELNDVAEELIHSTPNNIAKFRSESRYFETVLTPLERNSYKTGEERRTDCQCLMFLQYLFHLYKMKHSELRVKYPLPSSWNIKVKDYILDKFTLTSSNSTRRLVPSRMRDLQLSYILALSLKLNNFVIDLNMIATELKLPIKKLQIHSQALGCKVAKKEGVCTAELTFPPKFLEVKVQSAKKGKV